jgi:hypothetical protein
MPVQAALDASLTHVIKDKFWPLKEHVKNAQVADIQAVHQTQKELNVLQILVQNCTNF